jgi:adenylyltransferase/sulfurtransferase
MPGTLKSRPEMMDLNERYSRQILYEKIGEEGQKKIFSGRAAIIGAGALGSTIANNLCRAGLGYLRLIDRDCVELSNLPRQNLFDEDDAAAKTPKAIAARNHLAKINSLTKTEPLVVNADSSNIEELIKDVDVVLDGSDNLKVRFLVNEACHTLKIPWVYGGVLGASGNCLTILPDQGPCFRCFLPEMPAEGAYPTTATAGVLNMITTIIASMESAEALKIITGSPDINRRLFMLDVWNNVAEYIDLSKNPDCPVCGS